MIFILLLIGLFLTTVGRMLDFGVLERKLTTFYSRYGAFVSRHPIWFIAVPFAISILCAIGIPFRQVVTDVEMLFIPTGAPYEREAKVVESYWASDAEVFYPGKEIFTRKYVALIAAAKDGGNVLRQSNAKEFHSVSNLITNNITVAVDDQLWGYSDLCYYWLGECYRSDHSQLVSSLYAESDDEVNISFPIAQFSLTPGGLFLGTTLGGVEVNESTRVMQSAKCWMAMYHVKSPSNYSQLDYEWRKQFETVMSALDASLEHLNLHYFHSDSLDEETRKSAQRTTPKFVTTFLVVLWFSTLCCLRWMRSGKLWVIDWLTSKPLASLISLISTGMGITMALGLLGGCGVLYSDVNVVIPFLVVSIGVDDMFLMTSAFAASGRHKSLESRMSDTFAHSAVSCTITSLTDVLSFLVGTVSPLRAIVSFSLYASAAIGFAFICQMTFFAGFLVLFGKAEEKLSHSVLFWKQITQSPEESEPLRVRCLMGGSSIPPEHNVKPNDTWLRCYSRFLVRNDSRLAIGAMMVGYLIASIFGCYQLRLGFEMKNCVPTDSYAHSFLDLREKYFSQQGKQVSVVVSNVPNLAESSERAKIVAMLSSFEDTKFTYGRDSSDFWLLEYDQFLEEFGFSPGNISTSIFYDFMTPFLMVYRKYAGDLVWWNSSDYSHGLRAFRFTVTLKNYDSNALKMAAVRELRQIANSYAQYQVSTYNEDYKMSDQFSVILPNTLQNVGVALICMMVVSLLLIPHPLCSLWIAITILSIDIGVLGFMAFWNVNLDAIAMIAIIMSIGFSVDFSAHVSYGYITSTKESPEDRMFDTFSSLGWPIVQGATSTILGVLALSTVNSYTVTTFFKTVLLVMLLGLFHAIVVLPALLSLFSGNSCGRKKSETPEDGQPKRLEEDFDATDAAGL